MLWIMVLFKKSCGAVPGNAKTDVQSDYDRNCARQWHWHKRVWRTAAADFRSTTPKHLADRKLAVVVYITLELRAATREYLPHAWLLSETIEIPDLGFLVVVGSSRAKRSVSRH
jgi:hypothetical protein